MPAEKSAPRLFFHSAAKIGIALLAVLLHLFGVSAQDTVWEKPFIGSDSTLLFYPDQNAVYVRYAWVNRPNLVVEIKGNLPEARYFSFNTYNDYTKSSIAALADHQILPDAADPTRYTIYISTIAAHRNRPNTITVPDTVKVVSVFLRYYLPRGNCNANVPLPAIQMEDHRRVDIPVLPSVAPPALSGTDIENLKATIADQPELLSMSEKQQLASSSVPAGQKERLISKVFTMPIFRHFTNPEKISAYNFRTDGNYPNKDNHYIVMPVLYQKKSVLVVRFRAPTHASVLGDTLANVRYYSLSQGNEYTNTSVTMHDEQLKISPDGFVYVAVADDTKAVREKAIALGINFMPWLSKDKLVLILRHMLPNAGFNYSINEVPVFDNSKPAKGQVASAYIGEYALIGKFFSKSGWTTISGLQQFGF